MRRRRPRPRRRRWGPAAARSAARDPRAYGRRHPRPGAVAAGLLGGERGACGAGLRGAVAPRDRRRCRDPRHAGDAHGRVAQNARTAAEGAGEGGGGRVALRRVRRDAEVAQADERPRGRARLGDHRRRSDAQGVPALPLGGASDARVARDADQACRRGAPAAAWRQPHCRQGQGRLQGGRRARRRRGRRRRVLRRVAGGAAPLR